MRCLGVLVLVACGGSRDRADGAAQLQLQPLREGVEIVYELDLERAVDLRAEELARDLEARLLDDKVAARVRATSAGSLEIASRPDGYLANFGSGVETALRAGYKDTLETHACAPATPPGTVCVRITAAHAATLRAATLQVAVTTIRARLEARRTPDATVTTRDQRIVVQLPKLDDANLAATRSLIGRTGRLEFTPVDHGSDYARRLYAHVGSTGRDGAPTDPAAIAAGIRADIDQWQLDTSSSRAIDYYLQAHDRIAEVSPEEARRLGCPSPTSGTKVSCTVTGRAVIERYLEDLARTNPAFAVPGDRWIAYGPMNPLEKASDARPFTRTYLLERSARVTGASIADAQVIRDPSASLPLVLLDFNRHGATEFGNLTSEIVGKKLAIVVDGTVASAPIINETIRGGRASIALGTSHVARQEAEATELATILKTGSLPAPLRELSVRSIR